MNFKKYKKYSPSIVRFGVGAVFLSFGIMQLTSPSNWTGILPNFVTQYFNPISLVYFNGSFDLLVGIFLLSGLYTRIVSFFASLHLITIIFVLGFNPITIRDFGLLLALISIFFHGPDELCLNN